MIIAQITDLHIKPPGRLAYRKVDTAAHLRRAVAHLNGLDPRPAVVLVTGDLVDGGTPAEYAELRALLAPLAMPFYLVPGNHDARDALRAGFPDHPWLAGDGGFIHYAVDDHPVRLIGLDTTEPGREGGIFCAARARWLDATLAQSDKPTVLFMHHPPFATGMGYHDADRMAGREALAAVLRRHRHVAWAVCGHVHRCIAVNWAGVPMTAMSSTAHQLRLNLTTSTDLMIAMEPPGCQLLAWTAEGMAAHVSPIGAFEGPYPIFENGILID